ncbi:hypothetical protein GCM10010909_00860 [Acidocella aquatica]|uniref:Uncharacterized protein n=1 Tax=Acidocella aquatica TaxID=1922313 RepID=A0ABQ6A1D6_9PROT|nr:hypothetical protein GCM10010909_00860 [Acidocella aquatica]
MELWASSLRDVKGRIRPLFTQSRVAASAGDFLDTLLGNEPRKTGWMRAKGAGDAGPWRSVALSRALASSAGGGENDAGTATSAGITTSSAAKTGFWSHQRPKHLLTGLMRCGVCGGGYSKISATLFGCAAARA